MLCNYAGCRYAECRYAECRYAECRYAECLSAHIFLENKQADTNGSPKDKRLISQLNDGQQNEMRTATHIGPKCCSNIGGRRYHFLIRADMFKINGTVI